MEKGKTGKIAMPNNFDVHDDATFINTLRKAKHNAENIIPKDKHNIYFAGPWFDERSNELYNACVDIYKIVSKVTSAKIFFPREQINATPYDAFSTNVEKINDCDIVVALVSKKDVGTAWEIGMAFALKKPVYLLGYDETTFLSHTNVMLAFTGRCLTIDKFAKFLTNTIRDDEFVKIQNKLEGIE